MGKWPDRGIVAALMLSTVVLPGPLPAQESPELAAALALEKAVARTVEQVEPSVVSVLVSRSEEYRKYEEPGKRRGPGELGGLDPDLVRKALEGTDAQKRQALIDLDLGHPRHVPESYGSGVVIDEAGLVLTMAHVVEGATRVYIRLPGGRGSYADIHALDSRSDLAVLRPRQRLGNIRAARLGDGGKLRKGQFLVLISNPFAAQLAEASPRASWGMLSNLRQRPPRPAEETEARPPTLHQHGTLLEISTRVPLGFSGAGLFSLTGELVGITTACAALAGVEVSGGYAVPLDDGMKRIVEVLRRGEEVEYGFLGVHLSSEADARAGVHLVGVADGSPAEAAGLRQGDRVVAIDGQPVQDNDDLFVLVGTRLAGGTLEVRAQAFPGGPFRTVKVKLAKYHVPGPVIASRRPPARAGLRVDYSSIATQQAVRPPWVRSFVPTGVLVREVEPGSPADRARLQVNDIITRVNGRTIADPRDFHEVMGKASGEAEIAYLNANGQETEVRLKLD